MEFRKLLSSVFGPGASHDVLGDFEALDAVTCPAYYIHIVKKQNSVDTFCKDQMRNV